MKDSFKSAFLNILNATHKIDNSNWRKKFGKLRYSVDFSGGGFSVLKPGKGVKEIMAASDNVIVTAKFNKKADRFYLYPDINFPCIRYKIVMNGKLFPGLLDNSKIDNVLLLKYMREIKPGAKRKAWRLVVITDKGQVFHNFPSRAKGYDGGSLGGDIMRFEESVVWDCVGRKFPSQNRECSEHERYFPGLPKECYEHHPVVNRTKEFVDKYGNGGFDDKTTINIGGTSFTVSRFYFYTRELKANPFVYMGGFTNDYLMTTIGTYRNNIYSGARNCVFFSSDGGRQWYNRYEFGDFGEYSFLSGVRGYKIQNWGNSISICEDISEDIGKDLSIRKRVVLKNYNEPEKLRKKFFWEEAVKVSSVLTGERVTISTERNHGLEDGNVIAFVGSTKEKNISWMLNNDFDEWQCGSGELFKVEVLDEKTFAIHEFLADKNNSVCCRHIHHINRQKDGWLIGTGEVYPNGWLIFIQQKESDIFVKQAYNAKAELGVYRLNSEETSVQRTIGCELLGKAKMIYASDHATLNGEKVNAGKSEIERSSTGIFIGNTEDIDDITKFTCVFEAKEVGYFFRKTENFMLFSGQLGEFAISQDEGKNWSKFSTQKTLRRYMGNLNGGDVIDGYVILKNGGENSVTF